MRQTLVLCAVLLSSLASSAHALVFTVTDPSPTFTTGTLEWAIAQANENIGPDTIEFSIGSGPVTVYRYQDFLITDTVNIDGTSQPGFSGTPLVTVKFSTFRAQAVFTLTGSPDSIIRGLIIPDTGTDAGVRLWSLNCTVRECIIGTDASHELVPTYTALRGIDIGYPGITLSGSVVESCIIGHQKIGIRVFGCDDVQIRSCAIGADFSGNPLPLTGSGIQVHDSTGVYIGPPPAGDGNIIANCGNDGVALQASNDTVILRNRIYDINEMAIDHGEDDTRSPLDTLDPDISTGGVQNSPETTDFLITRSNGSIHVSGKINTTANTEILIEISASSHRGFVRSGESEFPVGLITVTTDGAGHAEFDDMFVDTLPPGPGKYYTATATRVDQSWGTSDAIPGTNASLDTSLEYFDPATDPGWVASGVDSGPESSLSPDSPDDVDIETTGGELRVVVRNSVSRSRIAGWKNPDLFKITTEGVSVIRGKFYIYSTNPMTSPVNEVPNFRIRLENEGAVLASTTYQYSMTGYTAPSYEPFYGTINAPDVEAKVGQSLRPSDQPVDPSLYRIDFVPVTTAKSIGTRIGATFESYAAADTANGTLALSEIQLATYNQLTVVGEMFSYSNDSNYAGETSLVTTPVAADITLGKFNVEADYQPGRLQEFYLPGEVSDAELPLAFETADSKGTILDTVNVPSDVFGIGSLTVNASNHTDAPRVELGKNYLGIFYASSDMPTEATSPGEQVQGSMMFELKTGGGVVTSRLELTGPGNMFGSPGSPARELVNAALPGRNSGNFVGSLYPFPPGERGGAYLVLMPSPLDADLRHDSIWGMGPFADEPGPGVDAPSYRDISVGMSVVSQPSALKVSPTVSIPWAPSHRCRVRLAGVTLYEISPIDDGGYRVLF